ncbi:MAG: hypothetical protein E6772_07195 [Dysgonomonas sp.]|nr:hypothetical protein [Dysgonomonas sp.]
MISSIKYPDEYSFVGNPMRVEFKSDSAEEIIIYIKIGDKEIIDLSVILFGSESEYKGSADISKILVPFFKKYEPYVGAVFYQLKDFELDYSLKITDIKNNVLDEFSGKAFRGGLNDETYAQLRIWGEDIFSHRLVGIGRQFLFTTRTNSRNIVLRETEMYPFVFIHPGVPIKLITSSGKVLIPEVFPENTICTFDVRAARKAIFSTYMEMPSYFVVAIDDKSIFEITLIQNELSRESYLFRFKNSLGAYEHIEVTGQATDNTSYSEEDSWMRFHEYGFYEENRSRVTSRDGLIVHTGYKSKDELSHIKDLIKSDEIYFIDINDEIETLHKCLITPEDSIIPRIITEPHSIELKIRFVTDAKFESPKLLQEYPIDSTFLNITVPGRPELNGSGFIYANDYALYAD